MKCVRGEKKSSNSRLWACKSPANKSITNPLNKISSLCSAWYESNCDRGTKSITSLLRQALRWRRRTTNASCRDKKKKKKLEGFSHESCALKATASVIRADLKKKHRINGLLSMKACLIRSKHNEHNSAAEGLGIWSKDVMQPSWAGCDNLHHTHTWTLTRPRYLSIHLSIYLLAWSGRRSFTAAQVKTLHYSSFFLCV